MRLLALLPLVAACAPDTTSELVSGDYQAIDAVGPDGSAVDIPAVALKLDVEGGTATFTDASGVDVATATLGIFDSRDWVDGCPTMQSVTHMEVASLGLDSITLGDLTFDTPILVADCATGGIVVLRDGTDPSSDPVDGEIDFSL